MPADYCPVVRAFIHKAREHWQSQRVSGMFDEIYDRLDELEERAKLRKSDEDTQRLRAFFCLHRLFVLLSTRTGGPTLELPTTREGIQELIAHCSTIQDDKLVELTVHQLTPAEQQRMTAPMYEDATRSLIGISETIIEAAEYLRPRLRNKQSMAGMGRFFATGLIRVRAPTDRFIEHGMTMLNVTPDNPGGLTS